MQKVKNILGKPFYEAPNCLIYNMDCVEGLSSINGKIFDLTITSPPYNIGKEYESIRDTKEYLDWCAEWIQGLFNTTKKDGAFWLNLGYISLSSKAKAIPIPYLLWDRVPFYLIQEIVWNYGAGVAAKSFLSPRNEKWLWYVKDPLAYTFNLDEIRDKDVKYPNQKKNGKLRCNTLGKNPSDVWQIAKVTSGTNRSSEERTNHPAQFPTDLITRIVKGFSNKGDLVCDPFMGSGSTAEACLRENRKVVGFEIRKDYCEIISDRIEGYLEKVANEKSQLKLFELV